MKKADLRLALLSGKTLGELLDFGPGQDCIIFKADEFVPGDEIIYIPDIFLNEIPVGAPITAEEIEGVLHDCYTGDEIIRMCDGDQEWAERLFYYIDWQHPSSALDEVTDDEDEEDGPE